MSLSRLNSIRQVLFQHAGKSIKSSIARTAVTNKYGIILEEPQRTRFGLLKVRHKYKSPSKFNGYTVNFQIVLTVVPGLLIGAGISKSIANFLEENELFVPSDDDDDDD